MYREIEKSLFNSFRENNVVLFKSLIVLAIIIQPIVLIFGAIPGYFFISYNLLTYYFWFSLLFLSCFSYVSCKIYNYIFQPRYFKLVIHNSGKMHFYLNYCFGHIRFAMPTWVLLGLGVHRSEMDYISLTKLILFFAFHVFFYLKLASYEMEYKIGKKCTVSALASILVSVIKPSAFHIFIYVSILTLYVSILLLVPNQLAKFSIAGVLMIFLYLVASSTSKIINNSFAFFSGFIKLVDFTLFVKINRLVKFSFSFLMFIPVFFLLYELPVAF